MDKGTVIRTTVLFVALVNQSLVLSGFSPLPFGDAEIENAFTIIFTVAASLYAWWKDNDVKRETIRKKKQAGLRN